MPATKEGQKTTSMDYLAAPRSEGVVKGLMELIGYVAPKNGRLPAGVKYDTLVALVDVFGSADHAEAVSAVASRVEQLQSARRSVSARVSATPDSIVAAVKAGKISLAELQTALGSID